MRSTTGSTGSSRRARPRPCRRPSSGRPAAPTSIELDPYPTDHRGVVSTFRVEPADPAPFAAVTARRIFVGDPLAVRVHGPGTRVVLVPAHAGPAAAVASRQVTGPDVIVSFDTDGLVPRAYDALLLDGGTVLSGAEPGSTRPGPGRASGRRGPSTRKGRRSACDGGPHPGTGSTGSACSRRARPGAERGGMQRRHLRERALPPVSLHGHQDPGTTLIGPASFPGYRTWPLKAGTYEIRMLMDDGYRTLAISSSFKIVHVLIQLARPRNGPRGVRLSPCVARPDRRARRRGPHRDHVSVRAQPRAGAGQTARPRILKRRSKWRRVLP